jgi:hypothetical protein
VPGAGQRSGWGAAGGSPRDGCLKERLREELLEQARTGLPVTYKELADRLELPPPRTIHRLTEALEQLMEEDVAAGRPLLAAFAVSKAQPGGIPARGFFLKAQALGVFSGDPAGREALDFHARELRRVSLRSGRR